MTRQITIQHADGSQTHHEATIRPTGRQHDHGDVLAIRGDGIEWDVVVWGVSDRG
jgi:hypothetical protein